MQLREYQTTALEQMRKRALAAQQAHMAFHKKVSEGKLDPWGELRKKHQQITALLPQLTKDRDAIFAEQDPARRRELILAFQVAMQAVGPYLQPASYQKADLSLTAQQQAELQRLSSNEAISNPDSESVLKPLTPDHAYTLTSIAVPVEVQAAPGASIQFRSGGGGEFQNGLPMQEIIADDKGVARTSWLTQGDASGAVMITVTSPQAIAPINFDIRVKGLALKGLPSYEQFKKTLEKTAEASKKLPAEVKLPTLPMDPNSPQQK